MLMAFLHPEKNILRNIMPWVHFWIFEHFLNNLHQQLFFLERQRKKIFVGSPKSTKCKILKFWSLYIAWNKNQGDFNFVQSSTISCIICSLESIPL